MSKNVDLCSLDQQGAGRNGAEQAFARDRFPNLHVIRAGARPPDSGRTTLHPTVVESIEKRLNITITDKEIHILEPEDITPTTIVLVLTDLDDVPPFVFERAYDVLLMPVADPFPNLEKSLERVMTQMYFYAYMLWFVVEHHFEKLGTNKDDRDCVIPRNIQEFQPDNWEPKFSLNHLQNIWNGSEVGNSSLSKSATSLSTPRESDYFQGKAPAQSSRSFFDDDWGKIPIRIKNW